MPNARPCNVALLCQHSQCMWKNQCYARGGTWSRFGPRASAGEVPLPVTLDAIYCLHCASTCLLLSVRSMKTSCLAASKGFFPQNGYFCLCISVVLVVVSVFEELEVLGSFFS